MKTIAITSMYANPIHPGHIECLELSKELAEELIVIVNSDYQARLKRGTESFQDEQYRLRVVEALKPVDRAVIAIDKDGSVCATLDKLITELMEGEDVREIIFTKGGDRYATEIPERAVLEKHGVRIVDGLGAKTHSSSSYVKRVANAADRQAVEEAVANLPEEDREQEYIEVGVRPWGMYYVLEDKPEFKVKKIIVNPGARLSLQSHEHRSEHWVVVSGTATVTIREKDHPDDIGHNILTANQSCYVPQGHVHRLSNLHDKLLIIVEVQCGNYTGEDDIVRYQDDYARTEDPT
jgi:cytidyltransferase-like protein